MFPTNTKQEARCKLGRESNWARWNQWCWYPPFLRHLQLWLVGGRERYIDLSKQRYINLWKVKNGSFSRIQIGRSPGEEDLFFLPRSWFLIIASFLHRPETFGLARKTSGWLGNLWALRAFGHFRASPDQSTSLLDQSKLSSAQIRPRATREKLLQLVTNLGPLTIYLRHIYQWIRDLSFGIDPHFLQNIEFLLIVWLPNIEILLVVRHPYS